MDSDPLLPMLYLRWQKLTRRCYPLLVQQIVYDGNAGLDLAIQMTWAAYPTHSHWYRLIEGLDYWLMTESNEALGHNKNLVMQFNLLTCEFLVNGFPLARLPSTYERNPMYQSLFGKSQLDVMPSTLPGMLYSCQTQYMAHTVHLAMQSFPNSDVCDLSVRAINEQGKWELILRRLLIGLIPDAFVEDYVHWYAIEDGCVEFRLASTPWLSSNDDWRLKKDPSRNSWYLERQNTRLISVTSQTAKLISDILQPIEMPPRIHCTLSRSASVLHIDLPRLRLGFYLQPSSSSLQCQQYPGMEIAVKQSLGYLTGLHNKLLLADHKTSGQILLIPEGGISWHDTGSHVRVDVGWLPETRLHAYSVDSQLGRLVDNGSLESKLLLCYLHALTSFCLPDSLTRMTGTEQSLSILRSASLRSFDQLRPEHADMLLNISKLTPARCCYPLNERVMQRVYWQRGLSYLTHHNGFYEEVAAIFDQDNQTKFLHARKDSRQFSLPQMDQDLLKRDNIRMSSFRISGFGAENHTQKYDFPYQGLTSYKGTDQAKRAFSLSKMIYDKIPRIRHITEKQAKAHLWGLFSETDLMHGPDFREDLPEEIKYDAGLIQSPIDSIIQSWCYIHRLIGSSSRPNKFRIMIWLSTLAFANDTDMYLIETIASIFLVSEAAAVKPPARLSFQPSAGTELDLAMVRAWIQSAQLEHIHIRFSIQENETPE